ncbi:MAG: hypothetical protein AB1736_00030 [Chloroflexota bacterium]
MLTDRATADLLDRFPEPEPVEGPPLTLVSSFPGIGPLELRGVAYTFDPEADVLSLSRAEWGYVLRAWTEHVLRLGRDK